MQICHELFIAKIWGLNMGVVVLEAEDLLGFCVNSYENSFVDVRGQRRKANRSELTGSGDVVA